MENIVITKIMKAVNPEVNEEHPGKYWLLGTVLYESYSDMVRDKNADYVANGLPIPDIKIIKLPYRVKIVEE